MASLGLARQSAVVAGDRSLRAMSMPSVLQTVLVSELTIETWALRLSVRERVVRRPRWWVETWRNLRLHVTGHARLTLLLLRRRGKLLSTLSGARHDALEEVCRTMTDGWRRWLRRAGMWALSRSAALFKLVSKARDLFFVPAGG